jgi:hypothetical protein
MSYLHTGDCNILFRYIRKLPFSFTAHLSRHVCGIGDPVSYHFRSFERIPEFAMEQHKSKKPTDY